MKALILNSGMGTRMGDIGTCKCLVEIENGITIADTQLSLLLECGVKNICVTTGAYADRLEKHFRNHYPSADFQFVFNPLYDKTNYIYSIYLALEFLREDILLLHGDLIFDKSLLIDVINSPESCMVVDYGKPLPEKDFKAVIKNGKITAVGVNYIDNAYYSQPLYKILFNDWQKWAANITNFCEAGNTGVYAEEALNILLQPLDAGGRYCFEVDNQSDLEYAKAELNKCRQ